MLSFQNDYQEGAHEKILALLIETNLEPLSGYGSDPYCESAKKKIQTACDCPEADVWFLTGGTQTNQTIIDTMLEHYEGVVSAETGHVASHEAGAIEYSGHKVLTIPQHEGKIDAAELETFLRKFWEDGNHEHMVFPGMVYISHPTEYGTLYTKVELENLSAICDAYQIPLFLDGARLGYGLAASDTDVTLPDIARCCHVFYIGGTKVGALCGEAVVFPRHGAPEHFGTLIKRRGALLAKGRLLGVQFDALFTDDLYLHISRNSIAMAQRLKEGLKAKGYPLYMENPTNQIFVILDEAQRSRLSQQVSFSFWETLPDGRTVVRFATSWATTAENVDTLIDLL